MNRFANKVLQLGEANVELQVRSEPNTPSASYTNLDTNKLKQLKEEPTEGVTPHIQPQVVSADSEQQNSKPNSEENNSKQNSQTAEAGKEVSSVKDSSHSTETDQANSSDLRGTYSGKRKESAMVELEISNADWFITCHQFISGLLFEPDLCQFFAEQSSIDLTRSSKGDDILSPYTKSIMQSH